MQQVLLAATPSLQLLHTLFSVHPISVTAEETRSLLSNREGAKTIKRVGRCIGRQRGTSSGGREHATDRG